VGWDAALRESKEPARTLGCRQAGVTKTGAWTEGDGWSEMTGRRSKSKKNPGGMPFDYAQDESAL